MLYEVVLIQKPTVKQQEEGKSEVIILAPTAVIARDDDAAHLFGDAAKIFEV